MVSTCYDSVIELRRREHRTGQGTGSRITMYTVQIDAEALGKMFEVWSVSMGRLVVAFRVRKDAEREVAQLTA